MFSYKIISERTWPNYRGGSDRQGCEVIVKEHHYQDDVQYGKSKLFVKSPQTVFVLENYRSEMIPGITMFLQKVSVILLMYVTPQCSQIQICFLVRVVVARNDLSASLHQDDGHLPHHGRLPEVQAALVSAQNRGLVPRR